MKEYRNPRLVPFVRHGAVDLTPALGLAIAPEANAGRTDDVAGTVETDKNIELKGSPSATCNALKSMPSA